MCAYAPYHHCYAPYAPARLRALLLINTGLRTYALYPSFIRPLRVYAPYPSLIRALRAYMPYRPLMRACAPYPSLIRALSCAVLLQLKVKCVRSN